MNPFAFNTVGIALFLLIFILGAPLTLYVGVQILNAWLSNVKPSFVRMGSDLGILVAWDSESNPRAITRVRIEGSELVRGGRSMAASFTFEDKAARKKSFALNLSKLNPDDLAFLMDEANPRMAKKSTVVVEVEDVQGQTVRRKFSKKQVRAALSQASLQTSPEVDVVAQAPDSWSVLTRVFPWKKVAAAAVPAADHKPKAAGEKKPAAAAAPSLVDFIVTKVWIEPGCIVCDACENEAPDVFQVLPDTCIVRENAPLDNGASIKAAAEGCPVNVIKYDSKPKSA